MEKEGPSRTRHFDDHFNMSPTICVAFFAIFTQYVAASILQKSHMWLIIYRVTFVKRFSQILGFASLPVFKPRKRQSKRH